MILLINRTKFHSYSNIFDKNVWPIETTNANLQKQMNFQTKVGTLMYFLLIVTMMSICLMIPELVDPWFPFDVMMTTSALNNSFTYVLQLFYMMISVVFAIDLIFISWYLITHLGYQMKMLNRKISEFNKICSKFPETYVDDPAYQKLVSNGLIYLIRRHTLLKGWEVANNQTIFMSYVVHVLAAWPNLVCGVVIKYFWENWISK